MEEDNKFIVDYKIMETLIRQCLNDQNVLNYFSRFDASITINGISYNLQLQINEITRI